MYLYFTSNPLTSPGESLGTSVEFLCLAVLVQMSELVGLTGASIGCCCVSAMTGA